MDAGFRVAPEMVELMRINRNYGYPSRGLPASSRNWTNWFVANCLGPPRQGDGPADIQPPEFSLREAYKSRRSLVDGSNIATSAIGELRYLPGKREMTGDQSIVGLTFDND